jgi:protein-S-isoprenylcysteine O-methyltransferase Ste14
VVKLPPPIWTLVFVLVAYGLSRLLSAGVLPGLPALGPGLALIIASVALAVWAALLFRRAGTEINPTSESNKTLVIAGPFRFSRNPMYLSLVMLALGIAISVGTWPMFLAPVSVFAITNWRHIPFEEAKMQRQFGVTFDEYCSRVRRWLRRQAGTGKVVPQCNQENVRNLESFCNFPL